MRAIRSGAGGSRRYSQRMNRRLAAVGGTALLLGIGVAADTTLGTTPRPWLRQALFRVQTHDRVVALTLDDGPDPRWTPTVLSLLERYRARATFFLIGRHALAYPAWVAAELAAGDEIGDHSYSHPDLRRLPASTVAHELDQGAQAIVRAGAPWPKLFRPPMGFTDATVERVADAQSFRTILWSVAVERYVDHLPLARAVAEILSRIRPGSIILAHDGGVPDRRRTLAALPLLLRGLQSRSYRVVDVSQLLQLASGRGVSAHQRSR